MNRTTIRIIVILLSAGAGSGIGQLPKDASGAEPPPAVDAIWKDLLRQTAQSRHKEAAESRQAQKQAGLTLGLWHAILILPLVAA